MKNKIVHGSDKDNFIWKMETVYNPIEKLHYLLAKWHLSKLLKINQEAIDKMYNRVYNDIIKEMNYSPKALTNVTAEQLINKIGEASHVIDKIDETSEHYWVSSKDIERGLENTAEYFRKAYPMEVEPMCNAVAKLEGDNNESID